MFSEHRLNTLSNILRDIGQVFFASMVVGNFLLGKDVAILLMGVLGSMFAWGFSFILTK